MELKPLQYAAKVLRIASKLLIVPYGIETRFGDMDFIGMSLLIVPYGIETFFPRSHESRVCLLIVPYGIETRVGGLINSQKLSFNRTLWN